MSKGTRVKTKYISATRDLSVARRWVAKNKARIVEIDLEKLVTEYYDFSEPAGRDLHLINIIAKNYANESRDVVIVVSIPASAIRLLEY